LAQNRIWSAVFALVVKLTAWMQMLAPTGHDARLLVGIATKPSSYRTSQDWRNGCPKVALES
jgi:hypothetical protein